MRICTVRPLKAGDYKRWKNLFLDYSPEWKMTDRHLKHVWNLLMDQGSVLRGWIVARNKKSLPVGFAHCVLYPSTCRGWPICYIHDLYVEPGSRRKGFGRALLKELKIMGKRQKWRYIYWKTDRDNISAQKLYDGIVKRTDRIYYELRF
jgi:ribosomal protein S18 acetylase RimI-like enzyme